MDGNKKSTTAAPEAPRWVWNMFYLFSSLFAASVMFAIVYWLFDKVGII